MDQSLIDEIKERLASDTQLAFKTKSDQYFTDGTCPSCNKKRLFISREKPFVLRCNRLNECGYQENIRDYYPDIFENLVERYPQTRENPNATADAYLRINRQFQIEKLVGWYSQEAYKIPTNNEWTSTVRFYLDKDNTRYWERLIDKTKKDGQKNNIGGKRKTLSKNNIDFAEFNNTLYKGEAWAPPPQRLKPKDRVFIVEGIFHAIALWLKGYKAIAAISANNFPKLFLRKYLGKSISWCIALDDDKAGRKNASKFAQKLKQLGEKFEFALAGPHGDWDDIYRINALNDEFIEECLYRGCLHFSDSIQDKAYHWYIKNLRSTAVLDFNNQLYSITVGEELNRLLAESIDDIDDTDQSKDYLHTSTLEGALKTEKGKSIFFSQLKILNISNCLPEFLYCQRDKISGELAYFFKIRYPHDDIGHDITLTGACIENPPAFNRGILNQAPGSTFDGKPNHLKIIRDSWFKGGATTVNSIPFVGYDKEAKAYVYSDFCFLNGKMIDPNEHNYFEAGNTKIKTTFKTFVIQGNSNFNDEWLPRFEKVFSDNGMLALAFWYGSLFAEQIRDRLGFFPFFEITGEHGAGKTTLIEFLWKLVGRENYEGFDPSKSTAAARSRTFSQVSNFPIVLIESDRIEDTAKKGAFDFEELKTAYNGRAIRSTGAFNRGNDVIEPPFRGTIVIAQNASVDGSPALLSRIVHCHATKAHYTTETKRLAPWFHQVETKDICGFLNKSLRNEDAIIKHITKTYSEFSQAFYEAREIKDDRVIQTHALVCGMISALKIVFPSLSDEKIKHLQDFTHKRGIDRQSRLSADHPQVQLFWENYEYLNIKTKAQTVHELYDDEEIVLNHSSNPDYIAVNLQQFKATCEAAKIDHPNLLELKKLLRGSRQHKFIATKNVRSKIKNRAVYCWVFENKQGEIRQ